MSRLYHFFTTLNSNHLEFRDNPRKLPCYEKMQNVFITDTPENCLNPVELPIYMYCIDVHL